jgi:hypothetical protein
MVIQDKVVAWFNENKQKNNVSLKEYIGITYFDDIHLGMIKKIIERKSTIIVH